MQENTSFSKKVKAELEKRDFTVYEKKLNMDDSEPERKARSLIRRRFLEAGSITDPNKDYHLEFIVRDEEEAKEICEALGRFSLDPKETVRMGHLIVYLKDASQISDVLNMMGAVDALMTFENVRILKEVSEKVNRRVNCETANLQRTVSAGIRQAEDISLIRDTIGFDALDPGLREIAELRLEQPNASLQELADALSEPIGKSGVNHRMRKLTKIASDIRERYGENTR